MQYNENTQAIRTSASIVRRRRSRGSYITELMGSNSIYYVLGAVALAMVALGFAVFKGWRETQAVSIIYSATHELKSSAGGYGANTDLVPILIQTDSIPRSIARTPDGKLKNAYGGEFLVTASDDGMYFTVTAQAVPASKCTDMVQKTSSSGVWRSIDVGSTTLSSMPISLADATAGCGTGDSVDIKFTSLE